MAERMKKTAVSGTWKTPPNLVYAQQQETPSPTAQNPSLGTKMQLMGLVQQKKTSPAPPPTTGAPVYSFTSAAPVAVQSQSSPVFISSAQASVPNPLTLTASPIDPSPFNQVAGDGSSLSDRKSPLKRVSAGAAKKEAAESPASSDKSIQKQFTTPEDKQRMLAHSRTMARLRRQQQRVLTDSLESEFFELCVSAAYLKAALVNSNSNAPLHSAEVDQIYQQATARSLEAMQSNIPVARSQELKAHAVSDKLNMPQAHFMPSLKLDDATAVYLAVTVGSRRESLSFSGERRKGALQWSTSGVRNLYSALNKDALPAVLASKCALGMGEEVLSARLRLSAEQRERLSQLAQPVRGDVMRVLACQKSAELLFSEAWLSLPKTEALMEQVRDMTTTEQMNKLISWSVTNEAQISKLSLGSVGTGSANSSPHATGTVSSSSAGQN
jgi:hypothetical protein